MEKYSNFNRLILLEAELICIFHCRQLSAYISTRVNPLIFLTKICLYLAFVINFHKFMIIFEGENKIEYILVRRIEKVINKLTPLSEKERINSSFEK